jgi:hypothetical protein
MKRFFLKAVAIVSLFYLVCLGWIPDLLPFIDEGLALFIFLQAMKALGYEGNKWMVIFNFLRKRGNHSKSSPAKKDEVIDV